MVSSHEVTFHCALVQIQARVWQIVGDTGLTWAVARVCPGSTVRTIEFWHPPFPSSQQKVI